MESFKRMERATVWGWRKGKFRRKGKEGTIGLIREERRRGVKRRNKKKS